MDNVKRSNKSDSRLDISKTLRIQNYLDELDRNGESGNLVDGKYERLKAKVVQGLEEYSSAQRYSDELLEEVIQSINNLEEANKATREDFDKATKRLNTKVDKRLTKLAVLGVLFTVLSVNSKAFSDINKKPDESFQLSEMRDTFTHVTKAVSYSGLAGICLLFLANSRSFSVRYDELDRGRQKRVNGILREKNAIRYDDGQGEIAWQPDPNWEPPTGNDNKLTPS